MGIRTSPGTVFALLVGIDDYRSLARPSLGGCRNDIAAARAWLETRLRGPRRVRELVDGRATVQAVVEGIRDHLGQAGPDDTALLWYSGHGTEFAAVSARHLLVEATGRCQALLCADGPLTDKRLGPLLDGVAASGARVTAVLDCCFSGGATREEGDFRVRWAPPDPAWGREAGEVLPDAARAGAGRALDPAGDAAGGPGGDRGLSGPPAGARHLLLAAGRLDETVGERELDGQCRGIFSHALLAALAGAAPDATGRRLLAAAAGRVHALTGRQHPVLFPAEPGGPADAPLLGADAVLPPSPHLLSCSVLGWSVDCGAAHGLREGSGAAEATEFTVLSEDTPEAAPAGPPARSSADHAAGRAAGPSGDEPAGGPAAGSGRRRVVRAVAVGTERTLVEPVGWRPDERRAYPVAVSALALPPASVVIDSPGAPDAAEWLRKAIAVAGPGGGPTPLLRPDARGALIGWRVRVREGLAHVLRQDGSPALPEPLPLAGPEHAPAVTDCLVHLTHWYQLLRLETPASPLNDLVRVEILDADGERMRPDEAGELVFRYGGGPGHPQPPHAWIRLRNRSSRTLWCALLDLTDSHGCHTRLYPGHLIGPGGTGYVLDGDPVLLSLPEHRPPRPGAEVRDWLKLIVSDAELNTVPFEFGPWLPGAAAERAGGRAFTGVLDLAARPSARDAGPARTGATGQWAAPPALAIRTVVPTTG